MASKKKLNKIFKEQFVNVILKNIKAFDKDSNIANLTVTGFFHDECESYVYLGTLDEVTTTIDKTDIGVIFIENFNDTDPFQIPPGTTQQ